MNIRKTNLQDKHSILKIANVLYLNMPEFVWNQDEYVTKQIQRGEYFVKEIDGRVAGIASFRKRGNKMYIETLAVHPDIQSNGIGKELIEFAKQYTKEAGLDTLCACAFFDYGNKDYYLKQGFSLLKRTGTYQGRKFHRFEMNIE